MATKAKRIQSAKLPEIGDVIEVEWRDSGVSSARTGIPPEALCTMTITNWGHVAAITEDDLIFWSSKTDPENSELWAIWIPSIVNLTVLKKSS